MNEEIGAYMGSCNRRSACVANGANWFNSSTRKYYCERCAKLINKANPEVKRDTGIELCFEITACKKGNSLL